MTSELEVEDEVVSYQVIKMKLREKYFNGK